MSRYDCKRKIGGKNKMVIPKYIQNKMHKIAEYSLKAKQLSCEVDKYFQNYGIDIEMLRCGNGCSLEELEYGNDITEAFCVHAEKDFSDSIWL